MSNYELKLQHAPIVEAVIDIDCDMPPDFELARFEASAGEVFHAHYPIANRKYLQQYNIEQLPDETPEIHSAKSVFQALQFRQKDKKQLVQVRMQGFSFNRLAPYTSLDDYLPEIQRTWELYQELAKPAQVRAVRLRYINRILLPCGAAGVALSDYFKISPRLPDEEKLNMTGFFNQYSAIEKDTGHQITIVLASQPNEGEKLPVIFDISVADARKLEPDDWSKIYEKIQLLRKLKNRIFKETLEETCLEFFHR